MYTWNISSLEIVKNKENLTNVVKIIHWNYEVTDENENSAKIYGSNPLDTPDQTAFIPYENLTFDIVVDWLEQILNIEVLQQQLQQELQNNINRQQNPPIVILPLPWETAVEETTTPTEQTLEEKIADGYNPDARDGDDDGLVQDGTEWERPVGESI